MKRSRFRSKKSPDDEKNKNVEIMSSNEVTANSKDDKILINPMSSSETSNKDNKSYIPSMKYNSDENLAVKIQNKEQTPITRIDELFEELRDKQKAIEFCLLVNKDKSIFNDSIYMDQLKKMLAEIKRILTHPDNKFALLIDDSSRFLHVDFTDFNSALDKLNNPTRTKESPLENNLYKQAYMLKWENRVKILVEIESGDDKNQRDEYSKSRLENNFSVKCIRFLDTNNGLENVIEKLRRFEPFKYEENKNIEKRMSHYDENMHKYSLKAEVSEFDWENNKLSKNYLKNFNGRFEPRMIRKRLAQVKIDEKPFSTDGNEALCFKGRIKFDDDSKTYEMIFKLSKYENLDLETNFTAQVIARHLSLEFSKQT